MSPKPSEPPDFDEEVPEEEQRRIVEEMKQDLKEKDTERLQEAGPSRQREDIRENIENAWDQLLEPHFKGTELESYSKHFKAALSNVVPVANIQRGDIAARYLPYFDEIWYWIKIMGVKIPPHVWASFRMVFELNLTRSIGGFATRMRTRIPRPEKKEEEGGGIFDFLK